MRGCGAGDGDRGGDVEAFPEGGSLCKRSGLLLTSLGLEAEESDEVDPEQRAEVRVGSAQHEGEGVAELVVSGKHGLQAGTRGSAHCCTDRTPAPPGVYDAD